MNSSLHLICLVKVKFKTYNYGVTLLPSFTIIILREVHKGSIKWMFKIS